MPGLAPQALAETIVAEFAASYRGQTRSEERVTQSAMALAATATTEALCKRLVDEILANPTPTLRRLAVRARDMSLVFQDNNYRDLGVFAANLAAVTAYEKYPLVTAVAQALAAHLSGRGANFPVLQVAFRYRYKAATGLAVFLPPSTSVGERAEALTLYRRLAFAQATGWDRLIEWLR